ncbi:MAG: LytTR family DNA-binding domain-containing protein [Bacteroidota bacterium]|nr:LytTR family DNA-binding domain-containing protein [Bacteroidota bacterium]
MLRCIIIDDEENCRILLKEMLNVIKEDVEVVAEASSVEGGMELIQRLSPDLVFLDVEMQDGSGFDLLKRFIEIDFNVVFTTAHEEFAIDAIRWSAVDYLLKPVSMELLISAVKKASRINDRSQHGIQIKALLENLVLSQKGKQKIVLKTVERIYSLDTEDVLRFESEGSYTKAILKDGKVIMVSRLIKEFDEMLAGHGFIRIHQSHLVNTNYLFCYEKLDNMVVMKDGSKVPVATRKRDLVVDLLTGL